jgi:Fe2+ or Zn2+ uptake regulation protein
MRSVGHGVPIEQLRPRTIVVSIRADPEDAQQRPGDRCFSGILILMSDVHPIARRQMTAAGHVYTRGRQALVDLLAGIGAPATIPMIMERSADLVQSSLYRNLAVMEQAGVVTRVDVGDTKSYYELSELVTDDHHHHLVCNRCTAVVDVSLPARAEQNIERALDDAARDAGFELTDHRVDIIGICPDCRAA